jgi:hypothetical protein
MKCTSCGKDTKAGVRFKCPECNEEIFRCEKCKQLSIEYKSKCGFVGP